MELRVPRTVLDRVRAHAKETYPEECCGFLIGRDEDQDRVVAEERRAPNVSPDSRRESYAIDNEVTRRMESEFRGGLLRVVGFYHSHPEYAARPSDRDRRSAWPYYVYAILSLRNREPAEVTAWRLTEEQEFEPVALVVT